MGEQIVADAQTLKSFQESPVILLKYGIGRRAQFIGLHRDRCAVAVGPGNHEDAIALQPMITSKDVARQMGAGDIALMNVGIGVGPGNCNQNEFVSHDLFDFLFFVIFVVVGVFVLVLSNFSQCLGQQLEVIFADAIESFGFQVLAAKVGVALHLD